MLDNIFINKFLTKYYRVLVVNNYFEIQDKITETNYSLENFGKLFYKIFTYDLTDDFNSPLTIAQIWLDARKYEITEIIFDYLKSCKVRLGDRNWEVYDINGNIISEKDIRKLGENNNCQGLYSNIFNKWLDIEIERKSMQIMGNYE